MDIVTFAQTVFTGFSDSYFFAAIKIFLAVYTVVLIIDIVLILSFRDLRSELRQGSYGTALVPSVSQSDMNKKWAKLNERLESGNVSEYKVAILEADNVVEGILKDIGYDSGADMAQKIDQLEMMQPDDAAKLKEVHQIRNRIVFEQDFHIDLGQAKQSLEIYKDFLRKFDYFQ
ncbi:MAG: hypothetical protein PHT88_00830 [Candidatus Moranbacteria bacterium]|nr:hypothetical protein [Candidatus Moranbacteria bacterium]